MFKVNIINNSTTSIYTAYVSFLSIVNVFNTLIQCFYYELWVFYPRLGWKFSTFIPKYLWEKNFIANRYLMHTQFNFMWILSMLLVLDCCIKFSKAFTFFITPFTFALGKYLDFDSNQNDKISLYYCIYHIIQLPSLHKKLCFPFRISSVMWPMEKFFCAVHTFVLKGLSQF